MITIYKMCKQDLDAVAEIEDECFTHPWGKRGMIETLRYKRYAAYTAQFGRITCGYLFYEIYKHRYNISTMAVAHDYRRLGVGTELVNCLAKRLKPDGKKRITLNVRETNLEAQLFFRSYGFKATEVLRNYYDNERKEDSYLMKLEIGEPCRASRQ